MPSSSYVMSRHGQSRHTFESMSWLLMGLGRLLFDVGVDKVVLYVGYENSAQKVYHRVGFVGLCGTEKVDGVEDSLELGFVGTRRGHW